MKDITVLGLLIGTTMGTTTPAGTKNPNWPRYETRSYSGGIPANSVGNAIATTTGGLY